MNAAKRMKLIRRRKRRSFLSLFLRRFIPGLLICAAIVLVGSEVLTELLRLEFMYSLESPITEESAIDRLTVLYDGKGAFDRTKYYLYSLSKSYPFNDFTDTQEIFSVYDPEEEKELFRTTEVMVAKVPSGKKTEPPRYYYFDIDVLGDLYDRWVELDQSRDNYKKKRKIYYYDIVVDDIYIKDDRTVFLGNVSIEKDKWASDELIEYGVVETRDLTPEDTTGMEHIIFDHTIHGSSTEAGYCRLEGAAKNSEVYDLLDEKTPDCFRDNYVYSDYGYYGMEEVNEIESCKVSMPDGKEYIIVQCFYISYKGMYRYILIISSAVIFAVMLLISLLLAYMRYVNEQAHYAVEDSRREMTNAMAHDLKSPLMAISGCAENMKNGVMPEKSQHYSELILSNVEYMNSIIANVLDLAKTEDLGKLKKSDTYLKDITENALSKYTDILSERGITAEITGEAVIKADSTLMMQAIENLVSNAVKYTPDNGRIDIRISSRKYTIKNDNSENTGKSADELWKPFIKGDNSRTAKLGSGLGLSIVKNICEKHRFRTKLDTSGGVFSVTIIFIL